LGGIRIKAVRCYSRMPAKERKGKKISEGEGKVAGIKRPDGGDERHKSRGIKNALKAQPILQVMRAGREILEGRNKRQGEGIFVNTGPEM